MEQNGDKRKSRTILNFFGINKGGLNKWDRTDSL